MNPLHKKVERPGLALFLYFGIGVLLALYGVRDGSLIIFDLFAGSIAYKMLK